MESFKITFVNKIGTSMIEPHFHDSYEIFFLLEGKRDYFIKNQSYAIQEKSLVFLSPKTIHKTYSRKPAFFSRYVMMIPKEFVSALALNYDGNLFDCFQKSSPILKLDDKNYDHILELFEQIYREYEQNRDDNQFILALLVTELLFFLNRYHEEIQPSTYTETDLSISNQIIDILESKYIEPITLEDISKKLYVSTYQVCRVFKRETGFTVMEYLNHLRLRETMRLLTTTNKSVTDIGLSVGFNNINHFIRTFKKHIGTTPKQYQLKHGES